MSDIKVPEQRLRLCYAKLGDARYIGHLDVARFWERVFRRVNLPIAYSHGFNPQARIQFASALPVGIEGSNELLDVWLLDRIDPRDWVPVIRRHCPDGFLLRDAQEVELSTPGLQATLTSATYVVRFLSAVQSPSLAERIEALRAQSQILRPHHKQPGKKYDLRPLIIELTLGADDPDSQVQMILRSGSRGNARATEVVSALNCDGIQHRIMRTSLSFTPVRDDAVFTPSSIQES